MRENGDLIELTREEFEQKLEEAREESAKDTILALFEFVITMPILGVRPMDEADRTRLMDWARERVNDFRWPEAREASRE